MSRNIQIVEIENYKCNRVNLEKYENNIENICNVLTNNNNGYHLQYNNIDDVILFGDLDNLESEIKFDDILEELSNYFNIEVDDIAYTLSKKENSIFSYHWSFNNYYCSVQQLKLYMVEFIKQYPQYNKYIDTSVYKNNSLFRLPMQTNSLKKFPHEIIKGTMKDFIFLNIPLKCQKLPEFRSKIIINNIVVEDNEDEDEDEYEDNEINDNEDKTKTINNKLIFNVNKTKKDFIINLLDIVASNKYDIFEFWIKAGLIIKNEIDSFSTFKNFSKKSIKYNKNDVKIQWDTLKKSYNKNLSIYTLMMWAKSDNITQYNLLKIEYLQSNKNYFNNKDFLTTGSISDYFSLCVDKFIFLDMQIYFFNGVYWKKDINFTILHNYLDKEYRIKLFNESQQYDKLFMLKYEATQTERDAHLIKMTKIRKLIEQLRNVAYRETLIKDIIHKITNNDIKMDMNPYLFGFNNKIYDLKQGLFIKAEPSQYISITTNYDFDEDYDTDNKKLYINELIKKILPDEQIRNYYLTLLSSGLDGIPLELFVIANGGGRNGKGLLHELTQNSLGEYAYILPVNILTDGIKTGGGSNVDIALIHNKRWVVSREPEENKKLQCGTLKELTGGCEIKARMNYSNNNYVKIAASFFFECNDKPLLNSGGVSIEERLIDVNFPNKFINKDKYDKLSEEEKKTTFIKNSYFKSDEFKQEYKQALFLILADYYKLFINNNRELITPDEIIKRNKEYLQKSDELLGWFNDKYILSDDDKAKIKLKAVYENYKGSEYFNNLTKEKKRVNNYKNFIEKLQTNSFLKKYILYDSHETYYLIKHKIFIEEYDENEEDNL